MTFFFAACSAVPQLAIAPQGDIGGALQETGGNGGVGHVPPDDDSLVLFMEEIEGDDAAAMKALPEAMEPPLAFVPGRMLIRFRPEHEKTGAKLLAAAKVSEEISGVGVKIIALPAQASEVVYVRAFRRRAEVEFAELDHLHPPESAPNDPQYGTAWHHSKINSSGAWNITTGSPAVFVVILDTGCDPNHPDLASKYVGG